MIASDLTDELDRMLREHGREAIAADVLVRMGVAPDELDAVIQVMLERALQITEGDLTCYSADEALLQAVGVSWLDGFLVGWSLSRRRTMQ